MQTSIQQQRGIDGFLWRELVLGETHAVLRVVLCQIGEVTLSSSCYRSTEFVLVEQFIVHHRCLAIYIIAHS